MVETLRKQLEKEEIDGEISTKPQKDHKRKGFGTLTYASFTSTSPQGTDFLKMSKNAGKHETVHCFLYYKKKSTTKYALLESCPLILK